MNRSFALDDDALRMLLRFPGVAFHHHQAFDNHAFTLRVHRDDFAALAFFLAGQHHDFVAFLNVRFHIQLQITSGASEIIFMNFFSRNSRATGPKMRVPRGLSSLSMITMALLSKRRQEPSLRRIVSRVRTTTASTTSPFLTVPSGAASLI